MRTQNNNKAISEGIENDNILSEMFADEIIKARDKLNPSLNKVCDSLGIDFIGGQQ